MKKIGVFPGSFDPITIGHADILYRASVLFDEVIVAIGINSQKKYLFPLEKRQAMIDAVASQYPNIRMETYEGLTVNFCKQVGANFLIRGLRSSTDFEYEKTIAQLNKSLNNEVDTMFLISAPQYSHISSTIVREIIRNDGDVRAFLPKEVVGVI